MRRRNRAFAVAVLGLQAVAAPLGAQPAAAATEPAPADPLYHVEIILFAYASPARDEEDFRHGGDGLPPAPAPWRYPLPALEIESLRDFGLALPGAEAAASPLPELPAGASPPDAGIDPVAGTGTAAAGEPPADSLEPIPFAANRQPSVPAPRLPDGFRILHPDELALTAEAARLGRGSYRLLGHVGWAQTGVEDTRAVPVDLQFLGITNPLGTIEFYIGRFRHAIVDLDYFDGTASFWTAGADTGLSTFNYAAVYSLRSEQNDLRVLRHVDHPLFGLLILITPAPEPAEDLVTDGGPAA